MDLRTIGGVTAAIALLAALPESTRADSHTPPKLLKMGTSTTGIAGPGVVVVQVLVHPDGTFKVQRIIRSSNPRDNTAATEIASTSSYKPATRGGTPVLEFYDFTLRFSGNTVENGEGATGTAQYQRMLQSGNAQGARDGLASYVASHPSDDTAQLLLGTAEQNLGHAAAAAAAFDKAGTIPDKFKSVAASAYSQNSAALAQSKDYPGAIAAGKKSIAASPTPAGYNSLGFAELQSGDFANAARDLEQARSLAADPSSKLTASQRATIGSNLVAAYVGTGDLTKAKAAADEVHALDPTSDAAQYALASIYAKQAEGKLKDSPSDAASLFEQAAQSGPKTAGAYYTRAAFAHLNAKPKPESEKALADAQKVLAGDPSDAGANFAAGVALANEGRTADALGYLNKADESAKKSNPDLAAQVEKMIAQLNGDASPRPMVTSPAPTPQPQRGSGGAVFGS